MGMNHNNRMEHWQADIEKRFAKKLDKAREVMEAFHAAADGMVEKVQVEIDAEAEKIEPACREYAYRCNVAAES